MFADLHQELLADGTLIEDAAQRTLAALQQKSDTPPEIVYVSVTHPGHHAAHDSFGGFCYVNHVAALARQLQNTHDSQVDKDTNNHMNKSTKKLKVAILDVDYHVGNGTAALFYDDPTVFVASLHCHPDFDYPFSHGFADQTGCDAGLGTTRHFPLPPGSNWTEQYQPALQQALTAIAEFGAQVMLVSLGLDTYLQDPVCLQGAGFALHDEDYTALGTLLGQTAANLQIPVVFVQEGGYKMDTIGKAAVNVVMACATAASTQSAK